LQPPANRHYAVRIGIYMEGAVPVAPRALRGFRLPIHAPPASDNQLHVLRRPRPAHGEQPFFGLGRRDAGQRADFRVRQLSTSERLSEPRQRTQRAGHADVLTSGSECEPHTPGEPVRARAEAIRPAAARVELADQIEQPRSRRVEMRGKLRDLIAEALELDVVWMSRDEAGIIEVHRRISLRRLYIVIFEASGGRQDARSDTKPDFFELRSSAR